VALRVLGVAVRRRAGRGPLRWVHLVLPLRETDPDRAGRGGGARPHPGRRSGPHARRPGPHRFAARRVRMLLPADGWGLLGVRASAAGLSQIRLPHLRCGRSARRRAAHRPAGGAVAIQLRVDRVTGAPRGSTHGSSRPGISRRAVVTGQPDAARAGRHFQRR